MWKHHCFTFSSLQCFDCFSGGSSSTGIEKAEMHDASTSTCVEMLDAAVGVDKITESPCHVAVQTRGIISYNIASQTNITTNNTCAVQTDDTASADSISHPEDKFSNCILSNEETTCSILKKQTVETELSRKVHAETEIQTQSVAENGILMHDNLKSSLKGTEKVNFLSVTSKQKSAERKLKKQSSVVRYDYNKPEKCSKGKVKKWESLTPQLCSDKSDDSSDEDLIFRSKDSYTPAPTTQSFRPTDKPLTQQSTAASSGSFVVEDASHLSAYPKEVHRDECLMPVMPHFHHHYTDMDPLLFRPNILNCALAMQSMAGLSKGCCYRNGIIDACANMNHPCVPQAGHTHHGPRKYFCVCSSCVNTGQSNHKSPESEVKVQISSTGSIADNKSAKRVWNRIIDTEDSSSDSKTGGDHKMPSRKMCLKNHSVNATYTTQIDSEGENTGSRRSSICTDKQDSSAGPGLRNMVTKMRKRREVARRNGRNSSLSTDAEIENKTSRLGNINMYLKGSHLQVRSSSSNKQEGGIFSRLRKRKNKDNVYHKKDIRKYMSKKCPLPNQKHKSKLKHKHLRHRHLNEHSEESDTSVMKIHSKVHSDQCEAVECMQDCQVGSYNAQVSSVLQSSIQQKTEAVTEKNIHELSSCVELFSTVSGVCSDVEQQSCRTAADIQTIQPHKVPDSVLNKRKRKASDGSADQVESKRKDCASLERQKSKRARTGFVSKESGDSVIEKNSEATSSILLHYVSESSPEKYITRTSKTATDISLPSTEQTNSDQEFKCSTENENCPLLNVRVNAHETGRAVGKTDPSRGAGPIRKLSKLEKFRRNLVRYKIPSKITTELPEKCLKSRKTLRSLSETGGARSKPIRPGVRSRSGVGIKANMSDSLTNVSNLLSSPQDHSTLMRNEKPSTNLDITVPSMTNGFVNLNTCNNSVLDLQLTCNSGTGQIFANTHTIKEIGTREEIHTETNHTVHVSRSFISSNTFVGAEIPACSQDSVPMSNLVTETASLSKVDHAPEIHSDSSLPDKISQTVKVLAFPVSYKESAPEANQTAEGMGLATSPHTYHEAEKVTKVRSPDTTPERCQAAADFRDVESPDTILKMDEMKDEIFPRLCQELIPCPVSPLKDPVIVELPLKSETVESSVTTLGTKQIAEVPVNGLSIKSPKRLARSSVHQKTGKEITMGKCMVNTSTDMKVFPGCVLRWVLKCYKVEYKKKHPTKSKSMLDKLKNKGWY
jgi:hypothetical protein